MTHATARGLVPAEAPESLMRVWSVNESVGLDRVGGFESLEELVMRRNGSVLLPTAFRSLPRPSSPARAQGAGADA